MNKETVNLILELAKTKTISQISIGLGFTDGVVRNEIRKAGFTSREIKENHAKALMLEFNCNYTIEEWINKTGFCRRKILLLLKKHNCYSRLSNKVIKNDKNRTDRGSL